MSTKQNKLNNIDCPASATLKTGQSDGAWYSTLMPSEHYDSMRTSRFPNTCNVWQIAGSEIASVGTRESVANYPNPYNLLTRERDELFLYGGYVGEGLGAYVAKIDRQSLGELWRIHLRADIGPTFDWPGVAGVHRNGFIYAVAGSILAKIDAESGVFTTTNLPEHKGQGGAAYNGFVISSQGILITKSMERGEIPANSTIRLAGLKAVIENGIPAFLVAVDPNDLSILATIETPEPTIGRITIAQHGGREYIYCPGSSRVWRYLYTGNRFVLDEEWQPQYVEREEQPGTACGVMNDWVIVQTNFLESSRPLHISAFHVDDCKRTYSIRPFPESVRSQEFSKPGLDPENSRIYTNDQLAGKVAALSFDEHVGFSLKWQADQRMASFWAIIGPKECRNIIGTNFTTRGDYVVWRNADSGDELAASDVVDPMFNGNIVSSGFNGVFYYLAIENQKLIELTLGPKDQAD